MNPISLFALCLALIFPIPSKAEAVSGNDFLAACENEGDTAKEGFCIGYLIGVIEGLRYGSALPFLATRNGEDMTETLNIAEKFLGACIPASAEFGQHRDIAVRYIERNPETRHLPARGQILESLRQGFPCDQ